MNEINWWVAYRSIVTDPQTALRIDAARLIGLHAGKSPAAVFDDPWSPIKDPAYLDQCKEELEEEERIRQEKKQKELADNGENS